MYYCKHPFQTVGSLLLWYAFLMLNCSAERALTFKKLFMGTCTQWKGLQVQKALFGLTCRRDKKKLP